LLGNLEVLRRKKLGIMVVHISNAGFWGPGYDPFTHQMLGANEMDMSKVIGGQWVGRSTE
jgi:hypothetical protein